MGGMGDLRGSGGLGRWVCEGAGDRLKAGWEAGGGRLEARSDDSRMRDWRAPLRGAGSTGFSFDTLAEVESGFPKEACSSGRGLIASLFGGRSGCGFICRLVPRLGWGFVCGFDGGSVCFSVRVFVCTAD